MRRQSENTEREVGVKDGETRRSGKMEREDGEKRQREKTEREDRVRRRSEKTE